MAEVAGPVWVVQARVVRWIDGDTLVVDIDLGWGTWRHDAHVRLLDIDTPERGESGYGEAKVRALDLCPPGTVVKLTSRKLDSFGRTLASLTLSDGRDLAEVLRAGAPPPDRRRSKVIFNWAPETEGPTRPRSPG